MSTEQWAKSSYSDGGTNCVEVARDSGAAKMRDTQHRESGFLEFGAAEWRGFIEGVKAGEV
jgi:hypothetical protein